jgi:hypothetical protein
LPSFSALHILPVLPIIEFMEVVVPPTSVELVTLDESFELIELRTLLEFDELTEFDEFTELVTREDVLDSMELAASMFEAMPLAHSPSAIRVTRYLIVQCSNPAAMWP